MMCLGMIFIMFLLLDGLKSSWIYRFIVFIKFGIFLIIMSSNSFLPPTRTLPLSLVGRQNILRVLCELQELFCLLLFDISFLELGSFLSR